MLTRANSLTLSTLWPTARVISSRGLACCSFKHALEPFSRRKSAKLRNPFIHRGVSVGNENGLTKGSQGRIVVSRFQFRVLLGLVGVRAPFGIGPFLNPVHGIYGKYIARKEVHHGHRRCQMVQ